MARTRAFDAPLAFSGLDPRQRDPVRCGDDAASPRPDAAGSRCRRTIASASQFPFRSSASARGTGCYGEPYLCDAQIAPPECQACRPSGDVTVTKAASPEFAPGGGKTGLFTVPPPPPPYAATWGIFVFRLLLLAVAIPDRAGPMPTLV